MVAVPKPGHKNRHQVSKIFIILPVFWDLTMHTLLEAPYGTATAHQEIRQALHPVISPGH
jgi:hypothetical protein